MPFGPLDEYHIQHLSNIEAKSRPSVDGCRANFGNLGSHLTPSLNLSGGQVVANKKVPKVR